MDDTQGIALSIAVILLACGFMFYTLGNAQSDDVAYEGFDTEYTMSYHSLRDGGACHIIEFDAPADGYVEIMHTNGVTEHQMFHEGHNLLLTMVVGFGETPRLTFYKEVRMMSEFKPCPFCGRNVRIVCQPMITRGLFDVHVVHEGMEERRQALLRGDSDVDVCIAESIGWMVVNCGSRDDAIEEAMTAWNRRV